ncbi:unnamed protein product [Rhizophagus irregularis]|nr:unnamed protein product [Rhizophagus irregularis]
MGGYILIPISSILASEGIVSQNETDFKGTGLNELDFKGASLNTKPNFKAAGSLGSPNAWTQWCQFLRLWDSSLVSVLSALGLGYANMPEESRWFQNLPINFINLIPIDERWKIMKRFGECDRFNIFDWPDWPHDRYRFFQSQGSGSAIKFQLFFTIF